MAVDAPYDLPRLQIPVPSLSSSLLLLQLLNPPQTLTEKSPSPPGAATVYVSVKLIQILFSIGEYYTVALSSDEKEAAGLPVGGACVNSTLT